MILFSPAVVSICSVLLAALVVLVHGVHGLSLVVECVHTLLGKPVSYPAQGVDNDDVLHGQQDGGDLRDPGLTPLESHHSLPWLWRVSVPLPT